MFSWTLAPRHISLISVAVLLLAMPTESHAAPLFWPAKLHCRVGYSPKSVAIGDLNGDLIPDLVAATLDSLAVVLGRGDGTFGAATSYGVGSAPEFVAISDLNGDKVLDIVVANWASDNVSVLLGVGDGTFRGMGLLAVGPGPSSLAIGDLDGDQVLDLAVAQSNGIAVLLGIGDGTFEPATIQFTRARSVAIGDLNGDQVLDLATTGEVPGEPNVAVFLGLGDGTFQSRIEFEIEGTQGTPWSLAVGEFNGDQMLDLVIASSFGSQVVVMLGAGDGTFGAANFFRACFSPEVVAVGDLDGDQALDLAVTGGFDSNEVAILIGTGDGTFTDPTFYRVASDPRSVAIGDLNGDQVLDLAVASSFESHIAVLLGVGGGVFGAAGDSTEAHGVAAAIDDLNGDGIPDLAVVNEFPGNLAVLLGVGDGTFGTPTIYEVGNSPQFLAIGDLNGDQAPDLVVTTYWGLIAVLLGAGNGAFGAATYYGAGAHNQSVAIGDLNGDQFPDLAVTGRSGGVAVLLGIGDGTFEAARSYPAGPHPEGVAIGDLNGDHSLDLAVANSEGFDVAVLLGVGDGTFGSPDFYGVAFYPHSVAIGDLNGDQVLDLAVASGSAAGVAVLLGIGDGSFSPASFYGAGDSHNAVAIGDLNGDQAPDLVVGTIYSYYVTGLIGEGDGTFGAPSFYGMGYATDYRSQSLAIADLNGDEALDLAVGCVGGLTILLGCRTPELVSPALLDFPPVAVGDTVSVDLMVSNVGLTRAPITNVTFPSPEMRLGVTLPLNLDAGASMPLPILLTPRQRLEATGTLELHTILPPATAVHVESNIRALTFSHRRVPPEERVEPGQELTVIVTPAPQVHIDRGEVRYSIRGIGGEFSVPLDPDGQDFAATIPSRHVTADGLDYYIQVENSGVLATDPPGAPDSTFTVGIRFSAVAVPNSGTGFLEGRDIQIQVTNVDSIESGSLHYRQGGESTYQSVAIDTVLFATIPGAIVGPRGIEYWMEIVHGSEAQIDPPGAESGSRPHTIRVTTEDLREEHDYDGDGRYRMVSVPLDFDQNVTLEALLANQAAFGNYDPMRWRAFRYAAEDSDLSYVELQAGEFTEAHRVAPGRAFWLASRDAGRIETAPITGTSTPTDSFFRIALSPGWSQVGNPFLFPVAWDSVLVQVRSDTLTMADAESTQVQPPVVWDADHYVFDERVLKSFGGAWVKNLADTTLTLLIPPRAVPAGDARKRLAPTTGRTADGWAIGIRAAAAGAVDDANLAGVSPGALTIWDPSDRSEPPMAPGESISLYFPHAAWERHPGRYSIDMRGAYEPLSAARELAPQLLDPEAWGHIWRFDVAKSFTREGVDEVQLDFTGLDGIPEEAIILLVDRRLETAVDLRTDRGYAFYLGEQAAASTEETARFVLLVGGAKFRDATLGPLPAPPARTALYPSYPNPFNPATVIRYDIASAGRVTVGIYDVRGALVRVLVEERQEPGRYEIGWNGSSASGDRMASGIYFCRLAAPGFSAARKMIMLR